MEIRANSEERAKAVLDVFKEKLVKRGVSLKHLDPAEPKASGKEYRISIALKEGITQENAKKVSKIIRDEGPSGVRAQVQGEELRVSSKKKDDLQAVISLLKSKDFVSPSSSPTTAETGRVGSHLAAHSLSRSGVRAHPGHTAESRVNDGSGLPVGVRPLPDVRVERDRGRGVAERAPELLDARAAAWRSRFPRPVAARRYGACLHRHRAASSG